MENLKIKATKESLGIDLNVDDGVLSFVGNSYPENTFELYQPVLDWISEYFSGNTKENTIINMEIIYYNSSSSRFLYEMFEKFDEVKDIHNIQINWAYDPDNDSTEEAGEDFQDEFENLDINLIAKE